MTIEQFLDHHKAQPGFRKWALENCTSMQDAWAKLRPEWLVWVATRTGVLTGRELRRFALACARRVQNLMTDPRSIAALDVVERYIAGNATDDELSVARVAAEDAAWDDAEWSDARSNKSAWASEAALAATCAKDAAARVVDAAVWAAGGGEYQWQSTWLRENTKPNFSA